MEKSTVLETLVKQYNEYEDQAQKHLQEWSEERDSRIQDAIYRKVDIQRHKAGAILDLAVELGFDYMNFLSLVK